MQELSMLQRLFDSDRSVLQRELLGILHKAHRTDPRDIQLCNQLLPSAGDYLRGWQLDALIQADVTNDKVEAWIGQRRVQVERYTDLLPTVFSYLNPEDMHAVYYAIARIDDFCIDAPSNITAGRKDHNLRKLLQKNNGLAKTIRNAKEALLENRRENVSMIFDEVRRGYLATNPQETDFPTFISFIDYLDFMIGAIEINRIEIIEGRSGYVPANNVKFETAELTYDLYRICGGPPIKTTPGSDFSNLASLLFELATGLKEESMAGAVIEFSRSQERKDADEHDIDFGPEGDRQREADNFFHIKEEILRNKEELELRKSIARKYTLNDEERLANLSLAAGALAELRHAERAHGPYLVWASQISPHDLEQTRRTLEERGEAFRNKKIELGELRRKALKD